MTQNMPCVLIVEDVPALANTYRAYLARERFVTDHVADGRGALAWLDGRHPDVVVLDVNLPDISGLEVLRKIKAGGSAAQVVIVTSNGSVNLAVDAMREGAFDFIVKPFSADRLRVTVRNALDRKRLSETVSTLKQQLASDAVGDFVGQSPAMQAVFRIVRSVAPSKATALITGESGTGKELCAAALHRLSKRANGPFVAINCAAIPRDLLESEIFGHVKGAFTGATSDRLGAALQADGGTLFLDEVGEMDLVFQAKMLRFLETGLVQRVGEENPRPIDVRIVAATNRDPRAEVEAGRFREDLFYRLNVISIELPALRDRDDDAIGLAKHFLDLFSREDEKTFEGFTPEAEQLLLAYPWPGNVRELKNAIRKIVVLEAGGRVDVNHFPSEIRNCSTAVTRPLSATDSSIVALAPRNLPRSIIPLETQIDQAIDQAISICNGSIPKAAAALRVSPSTLYRRLGTRGERRA